MSAPRVIPKEFCLGSDFCYCEQCGDKEPDYNPIRASTVSDQKITSDRDDVEDFLPAPKKQKVAEKENQFPSEAFVNVRGKASLSLEKKGKMAAEERFGDTSCEELTNLSTEFVPRNTQKTRSEPCEFFSSGRRLDLLEEIPFLTSCFKRRMVVVNFPTGYPFL